MRVIFKEIQESVIINHTCLNVRYKCRISSLEKFVLRINSAIVAVGLIIACGAVVFSIKTSFVYITVLLIN